MNNEQSGQQYIASIPDWFKAVARANTMIDASTLLNKYRFGLKADIGAEFHKQLLVYKNGFATYFKSRSETDTLYEGPIFESIKDGERMRALAQRGHAAITEADAVLELVPRMHQFTDFKIHSEMICNAEENSMTYITFIPYQILLCLEHLGFSRENPGSYAEVFDLFEPLRADTRILVFIEHLYPALYDILSKEFHIESPVLFAALTVDELRGIGSGTHAPSADILVKRQNGCVAWYPPNSTGLVYSYEKEDFDTGSMLGAPVNLNFDGVLKGAVAQKGYARGRARLVFTNVGTKEFNDGDIIVSTSTSPALMPLLIRCGGIVCDEGGIASHAAIISRELKKPCVIGTKVATQVLKDGDIVEVDADRGIVTVITS